MRSTARRTAYDAGAQMGNSVRHQWRDATSREVSRNRVKAVIASGIPGDRLGIHAHDDTGQAVANSLAADRSRACATSRARSTVSASAAAMPTLFRLIIPTLALKAILCQERFETGISSRKPRQVLTRLSHRFDETAQSALPITRRLMSGLFGLCDKGGYPRIRHTQGAGNL